VLFEHIRNNTWHLEYPIICEFFQKQWGFDSWPSSGNY